VSTRLQALHSSAQHLLAVAGQLDAANYESPAYPREWTIADTFSHIGSGAVIMKRRVEDSIAGRDADPDYNASIWDAWNAKSPAAQVADSLAADAALLEFFEAATEDERSSVHIAMGPMILDFDGFVGMRLSEHVLHTWDIEVMGDAGATLDNDASNLIMDNIKGIIRFAGKANGAVTTLNIRTTDPVRDFALVFDADSVSLNDAAWTDSLHFEAPAEAFVRLVYGRLDDDHTPATLQTSEIDALRSAFPGF